MYSLANENNFTTRSVRMLHASNVGVEKGHQGSRRKIKVRHISPCYLRIPGIKGNPSLERKGTNAYRSDRINKDIKDESKCKVAVCMSGDEQGLQNCLRSLRC